MVKEQSFETSPEQQFEELTEKLVNAQARYKATPWEIANDRMTEEDRTRIFEAQKENRAAYDEQKMANYEREQFLKANPELFDKLVKERFRTVITKAKEDGVSPEKALEDSLTLLDDLNHLGSVRGRFDIKEGVIKSVYDLKEEVLNEHGYESSEQRNKKIDEVYDLNKAFRSYMHESFGWAIDAINEDRLDKSIEGFDKDFSRLKLLLELGEKSWEKMQAANEIRRQYPDWYSSDEIPFPDEQNIFKRVSGEALAFTNKFSKRRIKEDAGRETRQKEVENKEVKPEEEAPKKADKIEEPVVDNQPKVPSPEKAFKSNELVQNHIVESLLSYQDANLPEKQKRGMLDWSRGNESAQKYARSLEEIAHVKNLSEIQKMSKTLRDKMLNDAQKIGLPVSPHGKSFSWASWDIGKQFYYFTHPNEADRNYTIANPLESEEKQREIIDRHLGWEAYAVFNNPATEERQRWKEKILGDPRYSKALAFLNKTPKENRTLSSKDLAELGAILRTS